MRKNKWNNKKIWIKISNDINTLYLTSKINKSKEKAKDFIQKTIKNSDILFASDKIYFYNDYYFNGIPIPKNIKTEKREKNLFISWDIDNSSIKSINTKIKYFLSIKRFGDLFQVCDETSDKFYYFKNYDEKNDYEIKIRTSIGDCLSEWSEIRKSKAEVLSSTIILENINNNDNNNKKNTIFDPFLFSKSNKFERLFGNNNINNKNNKEGIFEQKFVFNNFGEKNNNKKNSFFSLNPLLIKNENNQIMQNFDKNTINNKGLFFGTIDNNNKENDNCINGDIENNDNKKNNSISDNDKNTDSYVKDSDNNDKKSDNYDKDSGNNDKNSDNDNDKQANFFSINLDNKK